jgi:hypothetical protein
MVQVRAESALRHTQAQIRQRRGDEFDVELATRHRAQAAHAFFLNGAEEFGLEQHRQRVDLVQKRVPCAALMRLVGASGIGKGASLEAK